MAPIRSWQNACVLLVALATLVAAPDARAEFRFDTAQAKINWIDVSEAPVVKIYVSFLDRGLRPVPLKTARKVEVLSHGPDGKGRGEPVKGFTEGLSDDEDEAEILLFSKADESRDVVIVAAGHQDPELRDGDLGAHQREGLGLFMKKLGAKDHANVIWYNDRLMSYVRKPGKTSELSDLSHSLDFCREESIKLYRHWGMDPPAPEEGDEPAPAGHPCGLLEDYGKLEKIIAGVPYRGFYPRLMGFDTLDLCIPPRHERIGLKGPGSSKREAARYGGAIDEALRMLVQHGDVDKPKYLVVLSDGKDGYLDAQRDCRLKYAQDVKKQLGHYRASCLEQGRGRAFRRCMKEIKYTQKSKSLKGQQEGKLKKRLVAEQQRFRDERLKQWLALSDAANVHVYAVGYPNGLPTERERLSILAMKSGGTYREAVEAGQLGDMYNNLLDELANQYVIVFDAGVQALETASFSVKINIPGVGSIKTAPYTVFVPKVRSGLLFFAKKKFRWLESIVGSPWHIVITVVACLLALLFVYLFIKLILALLKKIFKKGKAAAKGAAKKGKGAALKGARGAARR